MTSREWIDFRRSLVERLGHAAGCLDIAPAIWRPAEAALKRCASVPELAAWRTCLPRELRDAPIDEYVKSVVRRGSVRIDLDLEDAMEGELTTETFSGVEVREIRGAAKDAAFAWGREALLSWRTWAPGLNPLIFEFVFDDAWPAEDADARARDAVLAVVPDAPGFALLLRYYKRGAMLTELGALRASFRPLLASGVDDYLLLPVSPDPAAWAISQFHHDHLQVGRRTGAWPHRVAAPGPDR